MRQKNISTFLALIVIISLAANVTEAGSKKRRGTAGAQELLIPVGSRGTAMAGAYVAGISGQNHPVRPGFGQIYLLYFPESKHSLCRFYYPVITH